MITNMHAECTQFQNTKIANAALCEVLSISWRPIVNCDVYRYRNLIENQMIRFTV